MKVECVKFVLMVQDMNRAIAFYRDVMGLEPRSQTPRWAELVFGDAVLGLHLSGPGKAAHTSLSFQVDDVDSACRQVADGGGKVVYGPVLRAGEPIRLAEVLDTEGNRFMVTQFLG